MPNRKARLAAEAMNQVLQSVKQDEVNPVLRETFAVSPEACQENPRQFPFQL